MQTTTTYNFTPEHLKRAVLQFVGIRPSSAPLINASVVFRRDPNTIDLVITTENTDETDTSPNRSTP